MASRKQEKEARRQERLQAEQQAESDARRKRLFAGLGAAALAAVIVVVALVVVSQSGDDDASGGGGSDLAGVDQVDSELAGIPQTGTVAGGRSAEVKIIEFGDLQCPACAQFSETVTPDVFADIVEPGDASIEFRNFVIIGPDSEVAAKAALAASEQDRYWQFIELFYRNQGPENGGYITSEFLREVAQGAGVPDLDAWEESLNDPKWDARLAETQQQAQQNGLTSTPSIVVEGPGGTEVVGSVGSAAEIAAAVKRVG